MEQRSRLLIDQSVYKLQLSTLDKLQKQLPKGSGELTKAGRGELNLGGGNEFPGIQLWPEASPYLQSVCRWLIMLNGVKKSAPINERTGNLIREN